MYLHASLHSKVLVFSKFEYDNDPRIICLSFARRDGGYCNVRSLPGIVSRLTGGFFECSHVESGHVGLAAGRAEYSAEMDEESAVCSGTMATRAIGKGLRWYPLAVNCANSYLVGSIVSN